ncbi:MAG: GNAT family N-acetyltransferase [Proteobacteria bacterium]|nr:GNAT family N-acetyltransferase [Pseudomonadota bacterium]
MHFTRKNQPALLEAALAATSSTGFKEDAVAIGASIEPGSPICAVGVFQAFEADAAEFHFGLIGEGRITPQILQAFASLAFHHKALNLGRVWARIEASNAPAQVAALKTGFSFDARVRAGMANGKDAILMSMTRPQPGQPLPG